MAAVPPHHLQCNPLQRHFAGLNDQSQDVVNRYLLPNQLTFKLDCVGCCAAYLLSRDYTVHVTVAGERVEFVAPGVQPPANFTSAFVRDSEAPNSANGQLVTNPDPAMAGQIGELLIASRGRTFQVYGGSNGGLAMGLVAQVRLERIALHRLRVGLVREIRVNITDAAIMELYRTRLGSAKLDRSSLKGQVYVQQRSLVPLAHMHTAASASAVLGPASAPLRLEEQGTVDNLTTAVQQMQVSGAPTSKYTPTSNNKKNCHKR